MFSIKSEFEKKDLLCYGCLSTDRNVTYLGDKMELFSHLLGNQRFAYEDLKEVTLCWECTALLKKVQAFQDQIKNAQIFLQQSPCALQRLNITSLSALSFTQKDTYDLDINHDKLKSIEIEKSTKTMYKTAKEMIVFENVVDNIKQEIDDLNMGDEIRDDDDDDDYMESKDEIYGDRDDSNLKDLKISMQSVRINVNRYKDEATVNNCDTINWKNFHQYYLRVFLSEKEMEKVLEKDRKEYSYERLPFKCVDCHVGYKRRKDLNRHKTFHHDNTKKSYKCLECYKNLDSEFALTKHWKRHTVMFRCKICEELCRSVGEMKKHVKRVHTKTFTCNKCNEGFSTLANFSRHYQMTHDRTMCDYCGKSFLKKSSLEKHILRHHLPPKCIPCNRVYTNYQVLSNHTRTYHPELAKKGELRREMSYCVECDKQFGSVYRYKRHLAQSIRHTPKKPKSIPCPDCGKIFTRTNYMNNHYKLYHTKNTKHICDICNKSFANGYGVRKHRQYVHEKIQMPKNKFCDLCGRGFQTNRILENHRRTHTGERPYKCEYCPATFAQSTAMKTHQKTQHKNVLTELAVGLNTCS